jgi:flagellar protein FlgJ
MNIERSSYFDFSALSSLKNSTRVNPGESNRAVAEKFEALFIDQMLQAMRKATYRSDLFNSDSLKTYESMFDKEIAEELARAGGVGLADALEKQLFQNQEQTKEKPMQFVPTSTALPLLRGRSLPMSSSPDLKGYLR